MDLGLRNKIVVVTGGAKGIGLGVAQVLAAEGAVPVIVGRNAADNATPQRARHGQHTADTGISGESGRRANRDGSLSL